MVITTTAIIAAVTTISISAARPAFAKVNCNEDVTICAGCESFHESGIPGGQGGRAVNEQSFSGGGGQNFGTFVGGSGSHAFDCDASGSCTNVGSFGHGVL